MVAFFPFFVYQRGVKVRSELVNRFGFMRNLPMPDTFCLLEQTAQIKYLHTIVRYELTLFLFHSYPIQIFLISSHIRNKQTDRDEFIFYSKRLMRVLIEYALSLLPFEVKFLLFNVIINLTKMIIGCCC